MLNQTKSHLEITLLSAIRQQLVVEGVSLDTIDSKLLDKIVTSYYFVLKSLWYKLSDSNADKFIVNYEQPAKLAMQVLEKYDFDAALYTFRKMYMNHDTKKVMTSHKNIVEFLTNLSNDKFKVLTKVKKQAKAKKQSKIAKPAKTVLTNAFLTNAIVEPKTTKKQVTTKSTKTVKPAKKSTKKSTKAKAKTRKWITHDMSKLPVHKTMLRIKFADTKKYTYGRFLHTAKYKQNDFVALLQSDGKIVDISMKSIASIDARVKA